MPGPSAARLLTGSGGHILGVRQSAARLLTVTHEKEQKEEKQAGLECSSAAHRVRFILLGLEYYFFLL